MKVLNKIIKIILITILVICAIYLGIMQIISSTVLSKEYVINKLEETNFYEEMYELVKSNFENYIYQSGLDEEVLENICSVEKVEEDIKIIISNIYDGTNQTIDTTEISENLNSNINELNIKTSSNSEAIEQFVEYICEEYTDTIVHTKYEEKINNGYDKIIEITNMVNKVIIIVVIIDILILIIINLKNISKFLQDVGIALLSSSAFTLISYKIITTKVNISGIKVFNDTFSKVIVSVIEEILSKIVSLSIKALVISLILILVYAIINAIKGTKEEIEEETTEK